MNKSSFNVFEIRVHILVQRGEKRKERKKQTIFQREKKHKENKEIYQEINHLWTTLQNKYHSREDRPIVISFGMIT